MTGARCALAVLLLAGCVESVEPRSVVSREDGRAVEALRDLATLDGNERAIAAVAREHPDTFRLAIARTFARQTVAGSKAAAAELATARRLAVGYARAWADSFFVHEVTRFERWSPEDRRARVAADSLRRAGIETRGREGVPAALALWREALARVSPVDTAGRAAALASVGAGFYLTGEPDSATGYLGRARNLAAKVGDFRTLGTAIGILASISREWGDLAQAAILYEEASATRERSGDRRGSAADHNNLGLIARELGDLDQARRSFERALDLNRGDGRTRESALNLTNLGDIANVRGEFARADSLYREALAINRADGDVAETGFVLHDLASLSAKRGQYVQALDHLAEALAVYEQTGAKLDAVAVRHDMAAVQAATGDLQGALNTLGRAAQDAELVASSPELGASLALVRADLAVQLGAFADAEAAYRLAERRYNEVGNEAGMAEAQQGRGLLLHLRGDHEAALSVLERAAGTKLGTGDQRAAALTQLLIGQVERAHGDTAEARRTLTLARRTLQSVKDPVAEAAALDALGQLAADGGATLAAEQQYRAALDVLADHPAAEIRWRLHAHLADALRSRGALGAATRELHDAVAALEAVAGGLRGEKQRVGYLAGKWDVYETLALIEQERGRTAEAFDASEGLRARQLRDLLARGHVPARREASAREQDLRRQITELLQAIEAERSSTSSQREAPLATASSTEVAREALARAQAEYADLILGMRESDPAYRALVSASTAPWSAVAAQLGPDEALLEYLVTDSTATVFVVTADTIEALGLNANRGSLANLIEFARRTMERPGSSPATPLWQAPLRRLYQQLIGPVAQRGLLEGRTRLVIAPHGELNFLHFGALLDAGDRFLIERFELVYSPSATVWLRLALRGGSRPAGSVLALAPRTASLPATREEVLSIRRGWGDATVLMGATATKAAFLDAADDHAILHIASYGILNKHNPLFSYVELAASDGDDGRLEVHEVYGLELRGQLVVLSACQTALGSGSMGDVPPGDDWVGLVQAFLYAGATDVLASLWPVEDRATARLMGHFYRSLRTGKPEATALAEAQRAMLRDPDTAHPFYWSGFVLAGGGRRN